MFVVLDPAEFHLALLDELAKRLGLLHVITGSFAQAHTPVRLLRYER